MTTSETLPGHCASSAATRTRRNLVAAGGVVAVIAAMGVLVSFAVPLYRLFCQVTGYGGTTQQAVAAPGPAALPPITVQFDANVASDMPWDFDPPPAVELRPGEDRQAAFTAINLSDEPVLGTATFNVTPAKVGQYFNKIECFCFTEQLLMPGERKDFPVTFFVDPAIGAAPNASEVRVITLSYTFFNKGAAARDAYLQAQAAPRKSGGAATR